MSKRSRNATTRNAPAPVATLASGAPVGETMRRIAGRQQRQRDEAFDGELRTVNQALNDAALGRTAKLINLMKGTRTRDSRQGAVCRTRVLALQRPWVVTPPSGYEKDREAIAIADRVRRILSETPGFGKLVGHLGHGILEMHAVGEHAWRKNDRGEVVSVPQWRHPTRFAWDTASERLCWFEPDALDPRARTFPGIPLDEYPGKFLVHAPTAGDSDYPWMRGVQRGRCIGSNLKRCARRWGLKALERWGQPQVFVSGRDGDSLEINDEMMDALRALGASWHARFPEGVEPKTIPATLSELHLRWIEAENTEDAIALLGQNLTTEVTGGSFAATEAHRHVRLDILASDLAEMSETLIDQWIRLIVEYNWPGAPVPVLDFILAPKGEITVEKFKAGLYTYNQVRAADGCDPTPDGDRYYVDPGVAPVPMFNAAPIAPKPGLTPSITTGDAPAADAAPDVAGTGLNGAQIKELKQLVLDIAAGVFPRESAEAFIGVSFPSVTADQIAGMLPPPGFTPAAPTPTATLSAAPPGGAVADAPFAMTPKSATATGTSQTSSRSTHPLARALSRPSAAPVR
jgi:hypothetical protein